MEKRAGSGLFKGGTLHCGHSIKIHLRWPLLSRHLILSLCSPVYTSSQDLSCQCLGVHSAPWCSGVWHPALYQEREEEPDSENLEGAQRLQSQNKWLGHPREVYQRSTPSSVVCDTESNGDLRWRWPTWESMGAVNHYASGTLRFTVFPRGAPLPPRPRSLSVP